MSDRLKPSTRAALIDLLRAFAMEHGMSEQRAEHEAKCFLDESVRQRFEPHCRTEEDHNKRYQYESQVDDCGYDSHGNYHGTAY